MFDFGFVGGFGVVFWNLKISLVVVLIVGFILWVYEVKYETIKDISFKYMYGM